MEFLLWKALSSMMISSARRQIVGAMPPAAVRKTFHLGEVDVFVVDFAVVDCGAVVGVGGVWRAEAQGVGQGEGAVGRLACGSAGEQVDLERFSGLVFFFGLLGQGQGDGLWCAGGGESAQSYGVSVFDVCGCLLGGHVVVGHFVRVLFILCLSLIVGNGAGVSISAGRFRNG